MNQTSTFDRGPSIFLPAENPFLPRSPLDKTRFRVVMRALIPRGPGNAIFAVLGDVVRSRLLQEEDLYFQGHPGRLDRARLDEELELSVFKEGRSKSSR